MEALQFSIIVIAYFNWPIKRQTACQGRLAMNANFALILTFYLLSQDIFNSLWLWRHEPSSASKMSDQLVASAVNSAFKQLSVCSSYCSTFAILICPCPLSIFYFFLFEFFSFLSLVFINFILSFLIISLVLSCKTLTVFELKLPRVWKFSAIVVLLV